MVKLVLQHKQNDHVKSSNAEELDYFFDKIPKSSSQKHENMNHVYLILVDDTERFVT